VRSDVAGAGLEEYEDRVTFLMRPSEQAWDAFGPRDRQRVPSAAGDVVLERGERDGPGH
jgi:hypothetical protein